MVRRGAPKWVLFIPSFGLNPVHYSILPPDTPRFARGIWLTHVKWLSDLNGIKRDS